MEIKMYNVGFGEAVLLKKAANGREENLLVDFGSDTPENCIADVGSGVHHAAPHPSDTPENCIADVGQTTEKNVNVTTEIYNDTKDEEVSVLLSHFHMDHICGVLETDLLDHVCLKRTYIPNLLLMQSRDNTYSFLQIQILRELFESVYLYKGKRRRFSLYDLLVKLTNNNATLQFVKAGDHFDFAGDSYSVLWPDFGKIKVNKKVSDSLTKLLRLIDADFNDSGEYTLRFIDEYIDALCDAYSRYEETNGDVRINEEHIKNLQNRIIEYYFPLLINQDKKIMKAIAKSIESIKRQENRISVVFQDFPRELEANLLMTGDIPKSEIKKIEPQIEDVHYKVIKAPHHGTPTYYWKNLPKSDTIMISNGEPRSQHRNWGKIAYEYAGFYNSNKKCKIICTNYRCQVEDLQQCGAQRCNPCVEIEPFREIIL